MLNKNFLIKASFSCILGLGACVSPFQLNAAEQEDECSMAVLRSYFPAIFVKETLSRFNVPEDQRAAIIKELADRDKEIINIVKAKASKMNPNPLNDPQQRQAAVKLFRDTLIENFSEVLKAHGVNDDTKIQSMLDDINKQRAQTFARCMQKQAPTPTYTAPSMNRASGPDSKLIDNGNYSDDDDDESDDDSETNNKEDLKLKGRVPQVPYNG